MIVIGLTGSIGMGKTTTANMLRDIGIPVHCADEAVHTLLGQNGEAVDLIHTAFPESYDATTNSIDRKTLGGIVFTDKAKKKILEDILHPLVQKMEGDFVQQHAQKHTPIVALDIPLLFETGSDKRVDFTICVSAGEIIQRQRVMARPGMTEEKFKTIKAAQMSDVDKRNLADFVVNTGLNKASTLKELKNCVGKIRASVKNNNEHNRFPS